MQQLKQVMLTRTNFISSFNKRKQLFPLGPSLAQQMTHDLLLQKKKFRINESQQAKLSQTVITQKIDSPYKLMYPYRQYRKTVMMSFAQHFLSDSDHQDIQLMVKNHNKHHSVYQAKDKFENHPQAHTNTRLKNDSSVQRQSQQKQKDNIDNFRPEKHLSSNIQDKQKLTFKIVKLYHDFFLLQKSSTKAEQIMHVYKKKLCDQAIIVPTIFCWLNDWIAKQFANFLKQQINELSHISKSPPKLKKQQPNRKMPQKQTIEPHQHVKMKQSAIFEPPKSSLRKKNRRKINAKQVQPDVLFSIDLDHGKSRQDIYQKIDKISMIQKNTVDPSKQQNEIFQRSKSKKRMSLQRAEMLFTIQGTDDKTNNNTSKEIRRLSIKSYETSNLLPFKAQINEEPAKKQLFPSQQTESSPINRQILIGAFYEKYMNFYKSLESILPDLDIQYIKQIKRNDRKKQIKKRIKEISRLLTRNQPLIKSSVDEYELSFYQRKRKLQKYLKNKQNRYKNIPNIDNSSINDPETEPATRYSSLDYSSATIQKKITSQKKINSSQFLKKEPNDQSNYERVYENKKVEKQKQLFSLNHPIKFQFNLPSLPQKQRNLHARLKQQSKIVLIQSGRYKLLDTVETKDSSGVNNRKRNLSNYSIELGDAAQKSLSAVKNEGQSSKKVAQFDRRSVSILEMITKKKKQIPDEILQISVKEARYEAVLNQPTPSGRKNRNKRGIRDSEDAQKQFKEVLQNLEGNDYGQISGWQKGEESPQMN